MANGYNSTERFYVTPVTNFSVMEVDEARLAKEDPAKAFAAEMNKSLPRCLTGGACSMVVEATRRGSDFDATLDCGAVTGPTGDAADLKEIHCLNHHALSIDKAGELLEGVAVVINRPYEVDSSNR